MTETCVTLAPRSSRLGSAWAPEPAGLLQISVLRGRYEEFQSSVIALAHLAASVRREPGLGSVLQSPRMEMQLAHQALREGVLGLLEEFARFIRSSSSVDPDMDGI